MLHCKWSKLRFNNYFYFFGQNITICLVLLWFQQDNVWHIYSERQEWLNTSEIIHFLRIARKVHENGRINFFYYLQKQKKKNKKSKIKIIVVQQVYFLL